jgi:hypothetical protein
MEKEKRKVEENIGKLSRPIWAQIKEKCFVKFGIDHPYYHGGKCNGKAMVKLLTKADEVMEAVKTYLLIFLKTQDAVIQKFLRLHQCYLTYDLSLIVSLH